VALVGGFVSKALLLAFPPFLLRLAQRLGCTVEIAL
jgi:hypothetical protein